MNRLISVALISVIIAETEPLFAKDKDYVLKLELRTDVETKVGSVMVSKKSDSRMFEVLIVPEHRFQGKTTWDNTSMSVKGKATESKAGEFAIEIDCRHSSPEGNQRARTTIGVSPGQTVFLGGSSVTSHSLNEIYETKTKIEFRLTLVEDVSDDESIE